MPLGEYMQSVLKSNKSILRRKKNKFDKSSLSKKSALDFSHIPKATPKQLSNIKRKIKNEARKKAIYRLLLFVSVLILIIVFVLVK